MPQPGRFPHVASRLDGTRARDARARRAAYLASDESAYTIGSVLVADGGMTL
jgi:NAD(P)-dependent dehydrogenase (short-subunit alcohol dehydrogenase family)